jgi:hypothetical protein
MKGKKCRCKVSCADEKYSVQVKNCSVQAKRKAVQAKSKTVQE